MTARNRRTPAKRAAPMRAPRPREGRAAPLYRQVVQTLKSEIVNGVYPIDSHLPTEGELRQRFGVSRHTVREALRELKEAGLIASRQGSGTTVIRPGGPRTFVHEVTSITDLIQLNLDTTLTIEQSGMVETDRALAEHIGVAEGERWLEIKGYRYAPDDPVPVCRTEVYVHKDFAGVARLVGRRAGPIYLWVEDMYGESIAEIEQTLRAIPVPAQIARALALEPDDTVIEVHRTHRLANGTVAIVGINFHPAARFMHSMTLRRLKS